MSPLTRSFLAYLLAMKNGNDELIVTGAKNVMKHYVDDASVPGDQIDDAIRKIIEKADAEDAYAFHAKLLTP